MSFFRSIISSWNPNKYHELREQPLRIVVLHTLGAAVLAVAVFFALLFPALLQADAAIDQLSKTTNITLSGSFVQGEPTFLVKNPDVLVSAEGSGDAVVLISREGLSVKKFIWFGSESLSW